MNHCFWTVLFKIDFFENSFNKDKSVGLQEIPCTKKFVKFALDVELAQLKFTYTTVLKLPKLGHIAKEFLEKL